jgi:RNA polymerase sigma factor (sigma-70 family)
MQVKSKFHILGDIFGTFFAANKVQILSAMFLHVKRTRKPEYPENNIPDEVLVSQYLHTGNKELIAILFERYTHLVYGICLGYLKDKEQAKDAVMEIFESLFDKLSVHQVVSFKNWIYSVSRNHCLMFLRKAASQNKLHDKILSGTDTDHPEQPEMNAETREPFSDGMILTAVDSLNAEQQLCVRLMYLQDKSYKDIADQTGYSLNQVKSHIQNGKRNLKNYLLSRNDTFNP